MGCRRLAGDLPAPHRFEGDDALRIAFSITIAVLTVLPVFADEASDAIALAPPQYRQKLDKQFSLAGNNRRSSPPPCAAAAAHREAMAVLLAHMPQGDLTSVGKDLLLADVQYACRARAEMPWGKYVKDELFFNYVLPYATVNERRDEWRKDFYQRFAAQGAAVPHAHRRRLVAQQGGVCADEGEVPSDEAAENGAEPLRVGRSRVRLLHRHVDPADRRLPVGRHPGASGGQPRLDRQDRQSLVGGDLGPAVAPIDAGEAGPFDETWVKWVAGNIDPKRRDHCVYAVSFLPAQTSFPFIWAPDNHDVPADDVTPFYLARKRVTLRVVDRPGGQPIPAHVVVRCDGRLIAEENVHQPVAFFLAGGTTYDLRVRPFHGTEEIGRQVHIAHDHDEATVVHVNAYASRRQPGTSQVAVRWTRAARRRLAV